jgi:putative RNA 2'-phosphotransferase
MAQQKANKKLAKMVAYMLGHVPGEFGLVPDENGFVKLKEFLKALHEEDGWRHVRLGTLREAMLTLPQVPFEMTGDAIRAKDRQYLGPPVVAEELPPLIYTCIRRRAYPRAVEKGVTPGAGPDVVLSSDRDMALRIGRRRDADPVVLDVQVARAQRYGVTFRQADGTLYLADAIPAGCFTGPALPKEQPGPKKKPEKTAIKEKMRGEDAGAFHPGVPEPAASVKKKSRKTDLDWKKGRKAARRKKECGWPDI